MIWYTVRWSDNRFAKLSFFYYWFFGIVETKNEVNPVAGPFPAQFDLNLFDMKNEELHCATSHKPRLPLWILYPAFKNLTMGSTETKLERARMWAGYKTKSSKQFKINRYRNKREQKNYSREWPIPGHLSFISIKSKTKRISIFFSSSFS